MTEPIAVIDVDTHVTEPPDLWTSRLPRRLRDSAPHVEWDPQRRRDRWHVGRHTLLGVQDQADAKTTIANNLAQLPDEIRRKVLHDTAARIYKLDA